MQLAQHSDEALGVLGFLFGRERAAFAQRGQHVVQAGERQTRVPGRRRQHALAMLVDLLGELGDALAQQRGQAGVFVGEGEGFKAAGFAINRVVAHSQISACSQSPRAVQRA